MVTATQSAHKRELEACWGKPTDHGLAVVLDTEKRSSTARQFERALRKKLWGKSRPCRYWSTCTKCFALGCSHLPGRSETCCF